MNYNYLLFLKWGLGILLILSLLASVVGLYYRIFYPQEAKERGQNLKEKFQSIPHPSDAQQIKLKTVCIVAVTYLRVEYKYDITWKESMIYYENELTRGGWKKRAEESYSFKPCSWVMNNWTAGRRVVFDKELFELKIGFKEKGGECRSIIWLKHNDFWGKWAI